MVRFTIDIAPDFRMLVEGPYLILYRLVPDRQAGPAEHVEIVRVVSLNLAVTGGATGIFGVPQLFEERGSYLLIFAPLLVLTIFFSRRLERSRTGRALRAIARITRTPIRVASA